MKCLKKESINTKQELYILANGQEALDMVLACKDGIKKLCMKENGSLDMQMDKEP